MSRTTAIQQAVHRALERRRAVTDADAALGQMTILIKLDSRSGRPRTVIVRTESRERANGE